MSDLRALAAKASPGPWVRGWFSGQAETHCVCADKGPLLGKYPQRQYPGAGPFHVHEGDFFPDDHLIARGVAPFTEVANNYGYETGGIVREADAAYIAACDPQTILALLDRAERAEAAITEVLPQLECQCDPIWTGRRLHAPDCTIDAWVTLSDALMPVLESAK